MQRSQSKILRAIPNAPRDVTNHILHTDFNIPYVSDVIHERIHKCHSNLEAHPTPLLEPLLQPISRPHWPRGLRRRSPAARLLRLWVRIPPEAWIFVFSGRGLCDGLITRAEESYRLWRVVVCDRETSKTRRLKPATGLWQIQPQCVVTPWKQTTNYDL
jgi:hypothetical protein